MDIQFLEDGASVTSGLVELDATNLFIMSNAQFRAKPQMELVMAKKKAVVSVLIISVGPGTVEQKITLDFPSEMARFVDHGAKVSWFYASSWRLVMMYLINARICLLHGNMDDGLVELGYKFDSRHRTWKKMGWPTFDCLRGGWCRGDWTLLLKELDMGD